MYNRIAVALAIRNQRLELNYSQEYVAGRLLMSQNAYSRLELGHTSITLERLVLLCEVLDTDIFEILKPGLRVA